MYRARTAVLLTALCAVALTACLQAQDAPPSGPYRGPQNNGIFPETGLLKTWPPEGLPLLWKARIGEGYSSVTVADGIVYVSAGGGGALYGFTLEGELKFKYGYGGCAWARFNGSRSTPLLRDGVAIVSKPNADVIALDLKTGAPKWTVNAWKGFGTGKGNLGWGYSCSPPVFEDKIILNPISRDDATPPIVAVDFATGKTVWEADAGKGKRYSGNSMSGVVFTHNGRVLNVNPTWRYTLCLDPKDGKRLWEMPEADTDKGATKSITPVYGDGYLLSGRAGVALCVKLSDDGMAYTPCWARPHGGFSDAVILGKHVYLQGNVTDHVWKGTEAMGVPKVAPLAAPRLPKGAPPPPSLPSGLLCVDAETGELLDFVRVGHGALGHVVAADGMVYVTDMPKSPEGQRAKPEEEAKLGLTLYLIEPSARGMEIRGQFRQHMTIEESRHVKELEYQANIDPVIAAGRLFVRYGPLWVYDLRPGAKTAAAPAPPAPAWGFWDLRLRGFFPENRDLWVTLQVKDGVLASGVAAAPAWNRATHTVDAKDAKLAAGGLSGALTVTLNPDTPAAAGKKPEAHIVKVQVAYDGGRLTGEYSGGLADGTRVEGRVTATPEEPKAVVKPKTDDGTGDERDQ